MIMDNNVTETEKIEPAAEPKKENDAKVPHRDKRHSKEEKSRKKDIKGVEQILKSLGTHDNVEDKLAAMCKKYTEILDENRKSQQTIKQMEKKITMIQREKDQIYAERNKAFLTRSKLESLCRELQKQNKSVKEESLLKIREEEEKRKEVSAKFQNTLAEITALMSQNNEENAKLHEDKMELTKKFNIMHEQMERFEKLHKVIKLEMTEEKETLLKEKQQLLCKLAEYHARIQEHQVTEAKLRSKITMYTDKYDEFQNAITKNNEAFGGFNEEMEKMSKKILKLEKETSVWKQRWENTHSSLLDVTADKQSRDTEIAILNRKCSLLQEICRGFQQERATLIAQLKEKNRSESDGSEDKNKIADKMAQLSSDCKKLQDNLDEMEGALSQKEANSREKSDIKPSKSESKTNKHKSKKEAAVVNRTKVAVSETKTQVDTAPRDANSKPQDNADDGKVEDNKETTNVKESDVLQTKTEEGAVAPEDADSKLQDNADNGKVEDNKETTNIKESEIPQTTKENYVVPRDVDSKPQDGTEDSTVEEIKETENVKESEVSETKLEGDIVFRDLDSKLQDGVDDSKVEDKKETENVKGSVVSETKTTEDDTVPRDANCEPQDKETQNIEIHEVSEDASTKKSEDVENKIVEMSKDAESKVDSDSVSSK